MTFKQIEASREIRLWITQIVVPAFGITAGLIATVPEFREAVGTKYKELKEKFKKTDK